MTTMMMPPLNPLAPATVDFFFSICESCEYYEGQRAWVEVLHQETGLTRTGLLEDIGEHPLEVFDLAVALVNAAHNAGRNVVVHRRRVKERSGRITAAAPIARDGLAVADAIERVSSVAPQAWPLAPQRAAKRWEASR